MYLLLYVGCSLIAVFDRSSLHISQRGSASFTSNIHRRHRIDPRLAFHMESLTFCMEVDLRRLLRRTCIYAMAASLGLVKAPTFPKLLVWKSSSIFFFNGRSKYCPAKMCATKVKIYVT